jgi:uncharacterized RDD family membrane protein YckC
MEQIQNEAQADAEIEYPRLLARLQSNFIDSLLIVAVMFAFAGVVGNNETIPGWVKGVTFFSFWLLYDPILTALGGTLGNYMMGVRVRRVEDYTRKISFGNALIRFVVKVLFGWWSFIAIHFNKERRALHDLAAGTIVLGRDQTKN